jgi:phosphoglycolate phosphatase-like HAD superfamily hydrolase
MFLRKFRLLLALVFCAVAGCASTDPLPSWNDGHAKSAIREYVERVTEEGSSAYIAPNDRIATFDNDGTLWAEQPLYFQLLFALDRVRELAPQHPEWRTTEPFKSVLRNDMKGVMASGKDGLVQIMIATHAGMTAEEFRRAVDDWLATARHPDTHMKYTEMVYQPMLELLSYLRANGFKTFIVSGGGIDFMRVFTERVYGIPPEQVVGTQIEAAFEMRDGLPVIVKEGKLVLLDDKAGKPVGIYQHIGRQPVFAGGNSDGDLEMLEYTTILGDSAVAKPRLGMIVHHTDAEREWAYDRDSFIGKLDKALDAAPSRGWIVVDMKKDWNRIFPGFTKERTNPGAPD